jgi:hypothetical protein
MNYNLFKTIFLFQFHFLLWIYPYIIKQETFKTYFLCLISLIKCNAKSITQILIDIFKKKEILLKLITFASDSALVMLKKMKVLQ